MIDEKELTLARRIAWKIGSKWSAVEIEDLTQELYLWLFENERTVERYRAEDGGEGKLFVTLRREASKYCAHEQRVRSGAPLDIDATYTITQLERALPFVFEDIPESVVSVNPVTGEPYTQAYNDYGLAASIVIDLKSAFVDMPADVKEVLALRFRDGMTYDEIGKLTGMSERGAGKRVKRAVARMQEALNG